MSDLSRISGDLQKLCKPRKTKFAYLDDSLAIYVYNMKTTIFLTNVFKDGCFLGFWSHSPWGRVQDQEQGWMVISPELKILDEFETRSMGESTGGGFHYWRKEQTASHGKTRKLADSCTDEQIWKITNC